MGDYVFISYSHKDSDRIHPLIKRMMDDGISIWYDNGIDPGTEWDENIAMHLQECSGIIAFLSDNYLESDNCRDELNYARDLGKERLIIYLDNVELPAGMAMRLNRLQAIHKYKYKDEDAFYSELMKAPILKDCNTIQAPPDKNDAAKVSYESIPYSANSGIKAPRNAGDVPVSKRDFLKMPECGLLGSLILIAAVALCILACFLTFFGDYYGCPVIIILTVIACWRLNYLFVIPAAVISFALGCFMIPYHFILFAFTVFLLAVLVRFDLLYKKYLTEVNSSEMMTSGDRHAS